MALSQKEFENAMKNAAMHPPTSQASWREGWDAWSPNQRRRERTVMRNVKSAVSAEANALMKFTFHATLPIGMRLMARPSIVYTGFPGGCGSPRMYEVAMNSPESQNGTVGVSVRM